MPKTIDFEGTTHEFPDDFSDADIQKALTAAHPLPAQPSALERFGHGLYETTVAPIAHVLSQDPDKTTKEIFNAAIGIDDLKAAIEHAKAGEYGKAALALGKNLVEGPAGRMGNQTAAPIVQDVAEGNYAGAAGRVLGTAGMLALGEKAPELPEAAAETAVKAARAIPPQIVKHVATGAGAGLGYELGSIGGYPGKFMGGTVGGYVGNKVGAAINEALHPPPPPVVMDHVAYYATSPTPVPVPPTAPVEPAPIPAQPPPVPEPAVSQTGADIVQKLQDMRQGGVVQPPITTPVDIPSTPVVAKPTAAEIADMMKPMKWKTRRR